MALALGLLIGVQGCSLTEKQTISPSAADAWSDAKPERELTRRQPKTSTSVAMGDLKRGEAEAPQRTEAEREALLDQARKSYQQALENDPKNLPALTALARLYASRGDYDRAVATYDRTLKIYPKEMAMWSELGGCHARKKEWTSAVQCLQKAFEIDPENRQTAHFLGFTLACAGRYEESFNCFQKTDGEAMAHFNLARMLQQMQQHDLSRQHLELALQKNPQLVPAQQMMAQLDVRPTGQNPIAPVEHSGQR